MIEESLSVSVAPGKMLFTVIPYGASSVAIVLDQFPTAPLTVLETPNPFNGILTEVEIIFIILPKPLSSNQVYQ